MTDREAVVNYFDKLNAIVTPIGLESKESIQAARAAYDALTNDEKALVENLADLEQAEADYAAVIASCEAMIGDNYYLTLADAYTAIEAGGTIKLMNNVDLSEEENDYIVVTKDIAFDLNGHTLTLDNKGKKIHADDEATITITIDNSVPESGGVKGVCGVSTESDSYILLKNVRLQMTAETVTSEAAQFNHIADGFLIENINGGNPDENGFVSIVRPIEPKDVVAFINAIGDVEYTAESKGKIDKAIEAYSYLTDEQKALVDNYSVLEQANDDYNAADAVVKAIDEIGTVEYTTECQQKIDAARDAYDELTPFQKSIVTNYETLTDAEEAFVAYVDALIEAIGTVKYPDSKEAIDTAREAYKALSDHQKTLVTKLDDLEDAEELYGNLKEANEAIEAIDAIGEVEYPASKDKLVAAREAYEALDDEFKPYVTNYDKLVEAEEAFVANVEERIEKIGTVEYTANCGELIQMAEDEFEALSDHLKSLVDNADELAAAKELYDAVDEAVNAIDAIAPVDYEATNPSRKDLIDTARELVDGLTDEQAEILPETKLEKLVDAETVYEEIQKIKAIPDPITNTPDCLDKIKDAEDFFEDLTPNQQKQVWSPYHEQLENAIAVKDAIEAVNAIGTVEYPDDKANIDKAKELLDGLTDEQKGLLDESVLEELADIEKAYEALGKIEAIGDVELTDESKALIDEAREAYNALTDEQKALIADEQLQELIDAEKVYEAMEKINAIGNVEYTEESKALIDEASEILLLDNKADLEKAVADYKAVDDLVKQIGVIGSVEDTEAFREKVEKAREAYDALTDDQEEIFPTDVLKVLKDDEAVVGVMDKVYEIGDIRYDDESKICIEEATIRLFPQREAKRQRLAKRLT